MTNGKIAKPKLENNWEKFVALFYILSYFNEFNNIEKTNNYRNYYITLQVNRYELLRLKNLINFLN